VRGAAMSGLGSDGRIVMSEEALSVISAVRGCAAPCLMACQGGHPE
jgi:hypothetical protein